MSHFETDGFLEESIIIGMNQKLKSSLKVLLPRYCIVRMQGWWEWLDIRLAVLSSRYRFTAHLYFTFFSTNFDREMQTVLLARRRYYSLRTGCKPNSYLLRRNVHRLEKGLIMRPRRDVFAEGYIVETVLNFNRCVETNKSSEAEISWADDVITQYFFVVSSTRTIDEARASFFARRSDRRNDTIAIYKPLTYSTLGSAEISFDQLQALCQRRHSMRWFEPKRVPRDLIDAAVDVAATAPSACNRQPYKFYVFDDPECAQRIGAIPMGTAGFSHNFQCVLVVVGDLSAYPFEKDRHIIYIDSGLAVMQMQLALETQGLASCCINWPDIERHECQMALELDLSPYQRPVMLLAVGYPLADALVPYSAKKNASDLVVWPE